MLPKGIKMKAVSIWEYYAITLAYLATLNVIGLVLFGVI